MGAPKWRVTTLDMKPRYASRRIAPRRIAPQRNDTQTSEPSGATLAARMFSAQN